MVARTDATAAGATLVGGGAATLADVRAAVVVGARTGTVCPAPRREVAAARAVTSRPVAATGDATTSEGPGGTPVPVTPPVLLASPRARSGAVVSTKSCEPVVGRKERVRARKGVATAHPRPREVREFRRLRTFGVVAAPSGVTRPPRDASLLAGARLVRLLLRQAGA